MSQETHELRKARDAAQKEFEDAYATFMRVYGEWLEGDKGITDTEALDKAEEALRIVEDTVIDTQHQLSVAMMNERRQP